MGNRTHALSDLGCENGVPATYGKNVLNIGVVYAPYGGMEMPTAPSQPLTSKPICVGFTCWRWDRKRPQAIVRLAQSMGVTVRVKETIHFLRRDIEAEVSGTNTDRFIGEFVRHC